MDVLSTNIIFDTKTLIFNIFSFALCTTDSLLMKSCSKWALNALTYVAFVDHMLLEYEIVRELWGKMEGWIVELGMENYHLYNRRIVLGDLENALSM